MTQFRYYYSLSINALSDYNPTWGVSPRFHRGPIPSAGLGPLYWGSPTVGSSATQSSDRALAYLGSWAGLGPLYWGSPTVGSSAKQSSDRARAWHQSARPLLPAVRAGYCSPPLITLGG